MSFTGVAVLVLLILISLGFFLCCPWLALDVCVHFLIQVGDLMQDLKTGHILRASPRAQFLAQLIGSTASVFVTVGAYQLYSHVYEIPSEQFQVRLLFLSSQVPPSFTPSIHLIHPFTTDPFVLHCMDRRSLPTLLARVRNPLRTVPGSPFILIITGPAFIHTLHSHQPFTHSQQTPSSFTVWTVGAYQLYSG